MSFGSDTYDLTNPFELRLGKYVDLDLDDNVIRIKVLRRVCSEGATRHLLEWFSTINRAVRAIPSGTKPIRTAARFAT